MRGNPMDIPLTAHSVNQAYSAALAAAVAGGISQRVDLGDTIQRITISRDGFVAALKEIRRQDAVLIREAVRNGCTNCESLAAMLDGGDL